MEKVFPVYAMGFSKADVGGDVSVEILGSAVGDPIWDAVREEAKLEVLFFFVLCRLFRVCLWFCWWGFDVSIICLSIFPVYFLVVSKVW